MKNADYDDGRHGSWIHNFQIHMAKTKLLPVKLAGAKVIYKRALLFTFFWPDILEFRDLQDGINE